MKEGKKANDEVNFHKEQFVLHRLFVIYGPRRRKQGGWKEDTGWESEKGGERLQRTRTLCIFNAIRMHRAKNIAETEDAIFLRTKERPGERDLYYQGPDFVRTCSQMYYAEGTRPEFDRKVRGRDVI